MLLFAMVLDACTLLSVTGLQNLLFRDVHPLFLPCRYAVLQP